MKTDKSGLIISADGGDTSARTGEYFSARIIGAMVNVLNAVASPLPSNVVPFSEALKLLLTPNGLVRNPNDFNTPLDTSRDQTRPMIIASGLYSFRVSAENMAPKGFPGKYQNGDVASPENWNEVRRALGQDPLWLGDAWAAGDATTRCIQAEKDMDDVGDDVNTLLTLVFFYVIKPTWTSKHALKFYLEKRPRNFGMTMKGEVDPVMGALVWYHRAEAPSYGNPEIAEAWRPVIAKLRSDLNCPV